SRRKCVHEKPVKLAASKQSNGPISKYRSFNDVLPSTGPRRRTRDWMARSTGHRSVEMRRKPAAFMQDLSIFSGLFGRADRDRDHLPIGQVPGLSQGAGVDRVLAAASTEAGPSTPL